MNYSEELTNTYDILGQIGEGGGGTVYRAVHKRLQKTVVLKRIKGVAARVLDCRMEVDILKNLKHPYLPNVLDFIESPEGIFTVMEFVPGKSMQKMLEEGHEFEEKEVLKYGKQLCAALEYLHAQNPPIIHGDIKPDNIMVTPEENICLIDFNISGVLEGGTTQIPGYTPWYSSPEQKKAFEEGNYAVDARSDIYSAGATLYTLLTGMLPNEKNRKGKKKKHISKELRQVLKKAMETRPKKRYADAGKFLQALAGVGERKKKKRGGRLSRGLIMALLELLALVAGLCVIKQILAEWDAKEMVSDSEPGVDSAGTGSDEIENLDTGDGVGFENSGEGSDTDGIRPAIWIRMDEQGKSVER